MHLESFEVLIIFLFIPCIGFAKKVRVKYSKYGSDIDFECAAKGVQEMSIGVKYTTTGCEVIPYTWPTSPPDGSTTLVKSFTEVTFPTQTEWKKHFINVTNERKVSLYAWNLPGYFGNRAELQILFRNPSGSSWERYQFMLYDSNIDFGTFSVYDQVDQMMFADVHINGINEFINVRSWNGNNFDTASRVEPSPFQGGGNHVLRFVARPSEIKITMEGDGVAFRSLPNVGPPDTVRTLVIEAPDEESLPRLIKVIYQAS